MMQEIFKIGIPAFLMVVLMGVTGLVVNLFLATYGNYAIASYGISFRLVQFPELIIMGLSEGVVPLIAYNFVSNKTRMKDTIKVVIVSIAVIFAVCMTVVLVAGHSIVQLFSTDPQIVVLATFILKSDYDIITSKWYWIFIYWHVASYRTGSWGYNYGNCTRNSYYSCSICLK